jgi:hypothetical protein
MKLWFALAVILCLVANARAQTGNELLSSCETLLRAMHIENGHVFMPADPELSECWGFIKAV